MSKADQHSEVIPTSNHHYHVNDHETAVSEQSGASIHSQSVANDAAAILEWPLHCKYFVPQLMDGVGAIRLIFHDGQYLPPNDCPRRPLTFVDILNAGAFSGQISPDDADFDKFLQLEGLPTAATRLLFVPHKRLYFDHATKCHILTDINTWLAILRLGDVPPNAVELLHDNNGGCWEHTSYCNDNNPKEPCQTPNSDESPCAYHLCFKLCEWGNYDHFCVCAI